MKVDGRWMDQGCQVMHLLPDANSCSCSGIKSIGFALKNLWILPQGLEGGPVIWVAQHLFIFCLSLYLGIPESLIKLSTHSKTTLYTTVSLDGWLPNGTL